MEDDLFDWHRDLQHGKPSYFLTEAHQRKGDDTVESRIIREGFEQAMEALERELFDLRRWAVPLRSADVMRYLEFRETMLAEQKTTIGEAFQTLKAVANVVEGSGSHVSHH